LGNGWRGWNGFYDTWLEVSRGQDVLEIDHNDLVGTREVVRECFADGWGSVRTVAGDRFLREASSRGTLGTGMMIAV
jgi:hypothetical protein